MDSSSGDLTAIPGTPLTVGFGLNFGTFDAAGTVLYLPHDNFNGTLAGAIATYLVNSPSGVLTPVGSYATGGANPTMAVLSPSGTFLINSPATGTQPSVAELVGRQ